MSATDFRDQLDSLLSMSADIAALRPLPDVEDRALTHCLQLTDSLFGFIGLLAQDRDRMEVVAIKGFAPTTPDFFEQFRFIPVRPSVFGIVLIEDRPNISNDVEHDPLTVGQPPGHPPVHTFLGVPLRVGGTLVGVLGVANKLGGYQPEDERLLSTFANQVAIAIDNARLYDQQRAMVSRLVSVVEVATHGASDSGNPSSVTDRSGSSGVATSRAADVPDPRARLNSGQREILRLVAEGFSNREIAARVHLSENTIKTHLHDIFRKLGVRNRVEAAIKATQDGLIPALDPDSRH